ncbi:341_t:CDS:2 [Diversispora eburnea]|uniref:341_t:CDS:1 n=1 Tax=Diversispora eburnea TaxID=1213867 RepID=A0A9N9CCI2_9GLOM|nr:341_t:CDS:2 [Diversispora eburnea]
MPKVTKSNNYGFIENPMRKVSNPPPKLTLPFPPEISPEELIVNSRKLPSKPPNAFFIYRKVYAKALITKNMRFKMTDVSPWVSSSWKLEPEEKTFSAPSSNYDYKETRTQTNSSSSSEQTEAPIEKLLTWRIS